MSEAMLAHKRTKAPAQFRWRYMWYMCGTCCAVLVPASIVRHLLCCACACIRRAAYVDVRHMFCPACGCIHHAASVVLCLRDPSCGTCTPQKLFAWRGQQHEQKDNIIHGTSGAGQARP
eukprot:scaffold59907_cov22-Tisochrysis_lutea.AAC.5